MEVDGKEFMRNVGLEQDKDKLAREQKRLEALKREAYLREEAEKMNSPEEAAFIDLSLNSTPPPSSNTMNEQTIEDIKLEQEDPQATKKKYILLGIALILVFVITILVIRLISNSDTEEKMENLNPQHKELGADKILDKIDTNEEYQQAIDKNLAKEESKKLDEAKKSAVPNVGLEEEKVENTPLVIEKPKPKELKKDLFGLNEQKAKEVAVKTEVKKTVSKPKNRIDSIYQKIEEQDKEEVITTKVKTESSVFTPKKPAPAPKKVVKSVVKKPVAKTTTASSKVSGYYVQIGAFTKQPSSKLLNEIKAKGFSYVVHPMVIKGKKYNKVLIGSYPTRKAAQNDLNNVKQKLKKSGAYILKF